MNASFIAKPFSDTETNLLKDYKLKVHPFSTQPFASFCQKLLIRYYFLDILHSILTAKKFCDKFEYLNVIKKVNMYAHTLRVKGRSQNAKKIFWKPNQFI